MNAIIDFLIACDLTCGVGMAPLTQLRVVLSSSSGTACHETNPGSTGSSPSPNLAVVTFNLSESMNQE